MPNVENTSSAKSPEGSGPRMVRAPRGTTISCKGWQQEAALRMIMNNLDPDVAERPQDLVVYGGSGRAAGSWIYIGSQGIVQGTYETFAEAARKHYGGTLKGKFVLTAGLGGMGGAQPLAITMNQGVCLAVEVDQQHIQRRLETGYCDEMASTLDEALDQVREACQQGQPLSIGLIGNAAEVYPELVRRGVIPDMVTDQTSAHDALNGYIPAG